MDINRACAVNIYPFEENLITKESENGS